MHNLDTSDPPLSLFLPATLNKPAAKAAAHPSRFYQVIQYLCKSGVSFLGQLALEEACCRPPIRMRRPADGDVLEMLKLSLSR